MSGVLRVRSSVRLEHRTFNPGVAGSIPVEPATILRSKAWFVRWSDLKLEVDRFTWLDRSNFFQFREEL